MRLEIALFREAAVELGFLVGDLHRTAEELYSVELCDTQVKMAPCWRANFEPHKDRRYVYSVAAETLPYFINPFVGPIALLQLPNGTALGEHSGGTLQPVIQFNWHEELFLHLQPVRLEFLEGPDPLWALKQLLLNAYPPIPQRASLEAEPGADTLLTPEELKELQRL